MLDRRLPPAAVYFPPAEGRYEVKPGLRPLGTDFGNGAADRWIFQFDERFPAYRQVKLTARAERLATYYQTRDLTPEVAGIVCRFTARRLVEEHPDLFALSEEEGGTVLRCELTGETLRFDQGMSRVSGGAADPPYIDPLDALASQLQEDLCIVRRRDGKDWAAAIHLCFPHRWTAEAKIGQDFVAMHLPVPHMASFRKPGMVTTMIEHGPYVRFAWDLTADDCLNRHHDPPSGFDGPDRRALRFDPANPRLFMRVGREVLWGFPAQETALLAIHVSFLSGEALRGDPVWQARICSAIESMSPESLRYKDLDGQRDDLLAWLRS